MKDSIVEAGTIVHIQWLVIQNLRRRNYDVVITTP